MHTSKMVVQSKSEGPDGLLNVVLRPKPAEGEQVNYAAQFSVNLPRSVARDFEPGAVVTFTLAVD